VTLRGKEAVIKRLSDTKNGCFAGRPELLKIKSEIINQVNVLSDNSEFETQYYKIDNKYGIYCFMNGIWMDVNDNSKIRTFEVNLSGPVIVAYQRDKYGPYKLIDGVSAWEISLGTIKNIISNTTYKIPFSIVVSGGKITEINEIYRP
jgi:hypothetical protein